MSELFSIQLQNRQQQSRDGVWLDLPTTTEQVQAALRQIGISSDNPQGLFISDYFAEAEKTHIQLPLIALFFLPFQIHSQFCCHNGFYIVGLG